MVIALAVAHAAVAAVIVGILGFLAVLAATIWLYVVLSLANPAVVLEQLGPVAALRRSARLARGSFWRLFGIELLAAIIVAVAAGVIEIPFLIGAALAGGSGGLFAAGGAGNVSVLAAIISAIGSIIASSVTRPISAGVTVLLYLDMRMRKEGLDIVLRNAAQREHLSGDELSSLWQPGAAGAGLPGTPAAGPPAW